ncbi:hypothetical protein PAEPH01_0293 [Pancytospora epiphaga]|nr:hypothetical protein PAEPH01_0293 [Pancytospora epiphaga]
MTEEGAPQIDEERKQPGRNDQIIRSLLCISPPATSRETKTLLSQLRTLAIPDIYNKIIRLNKLSNKELLHFVTIINTHPFYHREPLSNTMAIYGGLDLEALINLKFPAQDKYLPQIAVEYFSIVHKVFTRLTARQRLEIFAKYLYLLNNNICNDITLYRSFVFILRNEFLNTFINQKLYLGFPFLKEFLIDFREMGNSLIRIGYEVRPFRELVLNLALNTSPQHAIWLAYNWDVPVTFTVSDMFYLFNCTYFIDDTRRKHLSPGVDALERLIDDLRVHGHALDYENIDCEKMVGIIRTGMGPELVCSNKKHNKTGRHEYDIAVWVLQALSAKKVFQQSIQTFNETSEIKNISIKQTRISPKIDLKVLGDFLCKPKNNELFMEFAGSFNFSELNILESLRTFLSAFYMAGESQIIERVIRVFVTAYLKQNEPSDNQDTVLFDKYKSLAYSFVVLNTMLHNPSVEKRPAFDEYSRLVGTSEDFIVDIETLKSYYTSIKEREIKLPLSWEDSYEKYTLALELLSEPSISPSFEDDNTPPIPPQLIIPLEDMVHDEQLEDAYHSHDLCPNCILYAHQLLFADSYKNYFSMSPQSFERISRLFKTENALEEYIKYNQHNLLKTLETFKLYILRYILTLELSLIFLDILGHTLKPKASVFSDLKSLFGASKQDLHDIRPLSNLPAHISHTYENAVKDILNIKFTREDICNINLKMLYTVAVDNKKAIGATFLRGIFTTLLLSNANILNDISYLDGPLLSSVVQKNPSLVGLFTKEQKISTLLAKNDLDSADWRVLMDISDYSTSAFEVFCRGQGRLGHIEDAVKVLPKEHQDSLSKLPSEVESRSFGAFLIIERYSGVLKEPANVIKLFSSSNSILNLKIARDINKNGCPLNNPVFMNFDVVVYMLEKSSKEPNVLQNYALKVLGYLAANLILTVRMLSHVYSIFQDLDQPFRESILQIFLKRLTAVSSTSSSLCCALHSDTDISEVEQFVKNLVADSLVAKEDVAFLKSELDVAVVEL